MNQRTVLEQRITTLCGLLDAPGGPLGPKARSLGAHLQLGWGAERRLLQRLLAETSGEDVVATITRWRDRTRSFFSRSGGESPRWTDHQGHVWDANTVLALLDDAEDRIKRWLAAVEATSVETARAGDRSGATDTHIEGEDADEADDDEDPDEDQGVAPGIRDGPGDGTATASQPGTDQPLGG